MTTKTEKLDKLIEPVLVNVYDMAKNSLKRSADDETTVRHATLTWAKEEAKKACKEAGLKFYTKQEANYNDIPGFYYHMEEIEI